MSNSIPADLIKALSFAAHRHQYQRRGGYDRLPYINHLIKVVEELIYTGHEADPALLYAAALHDVVEDGHATLAEVQEQFGAAAAAIVKEVSDDMTLPEAQRKSLQITHAPQLSDAAKKLKIADKTCNIRDINEYPIEWANERKLRYIHWATEVVAHCRGINKALDNAFDIAAARAKRSLLNEGNVTGQ